MQVLLAVDGSQGAATAAELVLSLRWADGSEIRVLGAREPIIRAENPLFAPGLVPPSREVEEAISGYLKDEVGRVVERFRAGGLHADGHVISGRPASVLVEGALQQRADLVVVGSRGHGAIASLVLGSVSAELVDLAPCPVLVARRTTATRVLFATDGSGFAERAASVLHWPAFEGASIRVISVADVPKPWHSGVAPTMHHLVLDAYSQDLMGAKAHALNVSQAAASALAEGGRPAEAVQRAGDAAAEIIAEAAEWDADLVVLGSRGLTGLARIVLGSVARNVLQGTRSSVLVVRDTATAVGPETS